MVEPLPTRVTLERPLSRVGADVDGQVARLEETLTTRVALMRLITVVCAHVTCE
jgi:hypothetical protein